MVQVNRGAPTNNYVTNQTSVSISVKNISAGNLQLPIRVTLDSISPAAITSTNADGTDANGKPYFRLSFGGSSVLRPGETSSTKVINFNNPNKLRFNFTTKTYISVNAEGAGIIGSANGGTVGVTNPLSPLFGVSVEIPAGVLMGNSSITISQVINPPPPPSETVSAGSCVNITSSSNLVGAVAIKIPIQTPPRTDLIPVAKYYNEPTGFWEDLPANYRYSDGYMVIITTHFTFFQIFYEEVINYANSLPTDFKINTDSLLYQNEPPHPMLILGITIPIDLVGYCSGMSAITQWYYESKSHGLHCAYDNTQGKDISGFLQYSQGLFSINSLKNAIINDLNWDTGNNTAFNYMLKKNKDKKLARVHIEGVWENGATSSHSVLVAGWNSYVDTAKDHLAPADAIGYFDVMDGNDNNKYGKMYIIPYLDSGFLYMKIEYIPAWGKNKVSYNIIGQTPIDSWLKNNIEQKYNSIKPANWCPLTPPSGEGVWNYTGSMSTPRQSHTATLLSNGKVLVAGGGFSGAALSSAEVYDPVTGTFSATRSMSTSRVYHTATLLPNGKVLVIGGRTLGTGATLSSAELYDPATGTFTITGSMNTSRDSHTATLLPDGKVLIAGGFYSGQFGAGWIGNPELYDPATGMFSANGNMVFPRVWHSATLLPNGKVLIAGGWGGYGWVGNYLSSAELYDPTTGTSTSTGYMTTFRSDHTATLLPNGKVLIAGGTSDGYSYPNLAELYDPDTGSFSAIGSMGIPRDRHTATLLSNGKVLFAGGMSNGSILKSAELYDLATGIFSSTGSMSTPRIYYTATLLPNGKVLAVGGIDNSAELY
jgi:hypothetical protein